mgnify:CR=1 FL=1
MKTLLLATFCLIALGLLVGGAASATRPPARTTQAAAAVSPTACAHRVNNSAAKLVECVTTADLWNHMKAFQAIADANPGADGHPSRNSGEPGYKALKSVLDGSVAASTPNVLIYATSNRRHLLPEYMKENLTYQHTDDGEVHPGEGVEEKISLSERFGLWVSFYPFTQDEYLTIANQWLASMGIPESEFAAARPHALVWALERGSRSGRVAFQFAKDYAGNHA